jgi:hypothetical protein
MNTYIYMQLQKIGLLVCADKPVNEYEEHSKVKIKLQHVYGSTNWIDIDQRQLELIVKALQD